MNSRFSMIRTALMIGVALVIIIIVHYSGLLGGIERLLRGGINTASAPLHQETVQSRSWIADRMCSVSASETDLQERINALTQENARLSQELREFDQVRDITSYTVRHDAPSVLAHVIGTVNQPGTQALILDKGLRDGIKEQYAVIAGHGILMGKTAHVTDTTSQLILLNDGRSTVAAALINNAKATGLVEGQFGLGLVMNMIPSNEVVEKQSVAVTSGFESGVPGGLVIGTVEQIHHDDADLFQTATISPPLRYDQLNVVSIITATP